MKLKERLRGIVAAVATAALALAVVPTIASAAAVDENKLTVNNVQPNDTVTIYQIVKTTVDESNVATNDFVTDMGVAFKDWSEAQNSTAEDPIQDTEALASTIATYVNGHADDWSIDPSAWTGDAPKFVAYQKTAEGAYVEFTDIQAGQYLIVVSNSTDSTRVYQNTIASVLLDTDGGEYVSNTTASVNLKYTDLDGDTGSVVNKTINGKDHVDDVDAGDEVTFKITSLVPRYVANFGTRTYELTDEMDSDFEYVSGSLSVKAGASELEENVDYTLSGDPAEDTFAIKLTETGLKDYANQTLTVEYKATLQNTATYLEPATNKVTLNYSLNSNNGEKTSASDIVYLTVYGVYFDKVAVDEDGTKTGLEGAVFEVQDMDGNVVGTGTSGANGRVNINGALAAETEYKLVETTVPAGYTPIDPTEYTFTVESGYDGDTYMGYAKGIFEDGVVDEPSNFFTELPETGGTGTVALTVVGVGLMAGAAFLVIRSRKEN